MKFQKILMVGYADQDLGKSEWDRLAEMCEAKVLLPKDSPDVARQLVDTDCLLVKLGATVDKTMIDAGPNLKYIGMFGTGYGRVDSAYAASKGIAVCNIKGYSTGGVGELCFGFILEAIREICRAKSQAQSGNYSEAGFSGYEIGGKKFGVIGLGRIGGRIAEIASGGFHANVSYWSKNRKKDIEAQGITYQPLDILLKESDFLSINLAYVPETKAILNAPKIALIKPGAVVINLAPMELVDIDGLEKRLKVGDITFILDHSDEFTPEQAKQLSPYKNCILYPPIGYITREATQAKLAMHIDNIENFLKGTPTNKVN